ncbi:oxidoreductase [Actinocrispum wychmicini]|uniref:Cytochrome P450 n=1 Tax=Actinocrispum wychmicini TaxID=1213861 RepID=A0A4V2S5U2_9PSEU|nr:oxidoreductase [Actinocrispum wychmicini]TCO53500.1 cytochrome P450 [Actinocrispum wychmicini]
MDITGVAEVQAIIADPRFVPPPPEPAGPVGTMTWLRASVARFSSGEIHTRRRALVESELAGLDPARLGEQAAKSTVEQTYVPVAVLAEALGIKDILAAVAAVREVAKAYQGVYDTPPDAAVTKLVDMLEPDDPEVVANRIGLLVQACDATAALIKEPDQPPVRFTRRQALVDVQVDDNTIPAGTIVRLDISALPFGGDARPCPGRAHALALADGARVSPGTR